jgi:DNA repair protein RecO (recombination protein O)
VMPRGSGPYKTEALVLAGRAVGEADRIVTLLSPELGRFDAIARGARKSLRSRAGKLELFNQVSLQLYPGQSLPTVQQVEVLRTFHLVDDLETLASAMYLLELHQQLTEPGPHAASQRVYAALERALEELEGVRGAMAQLLCRRAELRLFFIFGLAPRVDACASCGQTHGCAWFSPEMGGLVCTACRTGRQGLVELAAGAAALLRVLTLPQAKALEGLVSYVEPPVQASLERALRAHLEWHWPVVLRSRPFLHQVQALAAVEAADELYAPRSTAQPPAEQAAGSCISLEVRALPCS